MGEVIAQMIVGFIVRVIVSLILAAITVAIANGPMHQTWNYFIVLIAWVCICYGGWWVVVYFMDSDG